MRRKLSLLLAFVSITFTSQVSAQSADSSVASRPEVDKFYIGSALDGLIFSTALIDYGTTDTRGKVRFTGLFNLGLTFNYNFSRHVGIYTGIDVKNVGFIMDDPAGGTAKYRTYNLGIPVGIRIGDLAPRRSFMFFGAGMDAPVNFKEKHFSIRSQKTKFNEWFSDRTPELMPYVFAGVGLSRGITFKIQYYPENFLNPGFVDNSGKMPYATYDVNLLLFSIGSSLPFYSRHGAARKHAAAIPVRRKKD